MKNLDELLIELRQVYDELNELNESNKEKKIDDIDFNKIKNKAKSIPLKNEILKNSKEYIQKSYLNLLASILHFNNLENIRQSQILYIARIIEGIGNKNITLEGIYSSSMEMSIAELNESITQVSKELADLFIVDMIICSNIKRKAKDEILEYISNIFSLMNVKFDVMKELIYLANSILLLDRDRILNTKPIVDLNRFNYSFASIINEKIYYKLEDIEKGVVGDLILINDRVEHIKKQINFDEFEFKSIKFINCKFNNLQSIVCVNKKIDFIGCKFENIEESYIGDSAWFGPTTPVDFMCIHNINMIKCKFENCNTSGHLLNLSEYILEDCEFINCISGSDDRKNYRGYYIFNLDKGKMNNVNISSCRIYRKGSHSSSYIGLIQISNSNLSNIYLNNCQAYIDTSYGRYAELYSCMIYGKNINIQKCKFEGCKSRTTYVSDGYYYKYILNLEESIQNNNTFIDCECGQNLCNN